VHKLQTDLNIPEKKINYLWKKSILVYNLLTKWEAYSKILQMSHEEINNMMDENN